MIWLFKKGDRDVRLETRFDNDGAQYVIDATWGDRPPVCERFPDYDTFHTRVVQLEQQLATEGWTQVGPPTITPGGWRLT